MHWCIDSSSCSKGAFSPKEQTDLADSPSYQVWLTCESLFTSGSFSRPIKQFYQAFIELFSLCLWWVGPPPFSSANESLPYTATAMAAECGGGVYQLPRPLRGKTPHVCSVCCSLSWPHSHFLPHLTCCHSATEVCVLEQLRLSRSGPSRSTLTRFVKSEGSLTSTEVESTIKKCSGGAYIDHIPCSCWFEWGLFLNIAPPTSTDPWSFFPSSCPLLVFHSPFIPACFLWCYI